MFVCVCVWLLARRRRRRRRRLATRSTEDGRDHTRRRHRLTHTTSATAAADADDDDQIRESRQAVLLAVQSAAFGRRQDSVTAVSRPANDATAATSSSAPNTKVSHAKRSALSSSSRHPTHHPPAARVVAGDSSSETVCLTCECVPYGPQVTRSSRKLVGSTGATFFWISTDRFPYDLYRCGSSEVGEVLHLTAVLRRLTEIFWIVKHIIHYSYAIVLDSKRFVSDRAFGINSYCLIFIKYKLSGL